MSNHSTAAPSSNTASESPWHSPRSAPETLYPQVTAEQIRNGADLQDIPWHTLPFTREEYRKQRMCKDQGKHMRKDQRKEGIACRVPTPPPPPLPTDGRFYQFHCNTLGLAPRIVHFQLKNLLCSTSDHHLFFTEAKEQSSCVSLWNSRTSQKSQVLQVPKSSPVKTEQIANTYDHITTLAARADILVAGAFHGSMAIKNTSTGVTLIAPNRSDNPNAILNGLHLYDDTALSARNDCTIRMHHIPTAAQTSCITLPSPVNHATRQPHGKMLIAALDENVVHILDGDNGKNIAKLEGHQDYCFATAWHPASVLFATGSQDHTTRVWDVRNLSESVHTIHTKKDATRALRFSPDGRFLAVAEARDFIQIYRVGDDLGTPQVIDFFGEMAGISFSPTGERFFLATSDKTYGGILEYRNGSFTN